MTGVFAPKRQGAPTVERLAEALDASSASASRGPIAVAWTHDAAAQTAPVLAVAAGGIAPAAPTIPTSPAGPFAAVRWDPERGEGFLAVDPLGAASLFVYDDGSRLTFASELADLLHLLHRRPSPNHHALVRWLADGTTERGETFFDGVRRLPGGYAVRLDERGWRSERYWSPHYVGVTDGQRVEHETRLAEGVAAAVERAAADSTRRGVLLSGGLDSTTVAALAVRQGPLRSYSAVFPDHPEIDEAEQIELVTERLRLDAIRMPTRDVTILASSEEYLRRWEVPPSSPMLGMHRPLLERIADDDIDTLLDGQGGDELFGESRFLVSDRVRTGRVRSAADLALLASPHEPVWRTLVELGLKANLPTATHRAARRLRPLQYAPHWLQSQAARLYAQEQDGWSWKQLDGPRWWAFLADQLTAHRERWGVHDYLRHKSALAGARGRHPFLQDLDLIRLVLSLPPELAFDATLDRPLLRRSMAGLVPDEIRLAERKPVFTRIFVDAMRGADYENVVSILQPKAEIFAFVRPEAVERLFLATDQERLAPTWAWTLWRLAVCETWLQRQRSND